MVVNYFSLIILFFLFCNPAFSQTKLENDSINIELTRCLEKTENETTNGMCECTYNALTKWDKKLNLTYKSLLEKLDSSTKIKLIETQRAWIKFKEKEIDLIDATIGKADGTIWRIIRADKLLDITRSRAVDLEYFLETIGEF